MATRDFCLGKLDGCLLRSTGEEMVPTRMAHATERHHAVMFERADGSLASGAHTSGEVGARGKEAEWLTDMPTCQRASSGGVGELGRVRQNWPTNRVCSFLFLFYSIFYFWFHFTL